MASADLVPLSTIDAFTPEQRAFLKQYWITSAQEFLELLRRPLEGSQKGETFLTPRLGLDKAGMDRLYEAAKAAVPGFAFDAVYDEEEPPGGCLFDEADLNLPLSFAGGEPPPDKNLAPPDWPAEQQGSRNTCVAFTVLAMYRLLSGDATNLSEQFLFWAAKQYENPDDARGLLPASAMKAFQERGVCLEQHWPYNPERVYRPSDRLEDVPQGPPPAAALDDAPRRKILGFQALQPRDVAAIREEVFNGHPVLIGMPFHRYWREGFQGRVLGRIRPPLEAGEPLRGGHAMCVVGYRADADAPGGGYFIVRNSWGADCGAENLDGIGYCHIPYALIREHNMAAYAMAVAQGAGAAGGMVAGARGGTAGDDLAEARALLARIQGDVAQLAALLARIGDGR